MDEHEEPVAKKSNVWVIWLLVIVIAGLTIYIFNQKHKKSECEKKALNAAVDTYVGREDLTAGQRQQLEDDYQARYMQSCSQQ